MGQTKTFFEVFSKYQPSEEKLLALAGSGVSALRFDRDNGRVEIELTAPAPIDADILYDLADECRVLYGLSSFRIFPHFPPETYTADRFPEIATEAALSGAVTHGFFSNAKVSDDGERITVTIPFCEEGAQFVKNADTEAILSRILFSRYGVTRTFSVEAGAELAAMREAELAAYRERKMAEAQLQNAEQARAAHAEYLKRKEDEARAADPHYDFEKKAGLAADVFRAAAISETRFAMGGSVFETKDAEVLYGDDFEITEPSPIANAPKEHGSGTIFLGVIFEVTMKENRAGDRVSCSFGLSDGSCGIYMKKSLPPEEIGWVKDLEEKVGKKGPVPVAALGRIMTDKFDRDQEQFLSLRGLKKIKKIERTDDAPEKRVELHLHSNMSQMDAIITPAEIVNTAIRWGHRAIAVTDHGNVQAFPEVMLALEKSGNTDLKILYGMEGYFVNDTARCVFGSKEVSFDDEMIAFDIETTGLSNRTCKIIEIGAVKIKNGEVLDEMDIFVDPECHIPEAITELTSITDEMVAGAPKEKEAVEKFLAFAGDRLLIAHNANFDVGFIRVACERNGIPFEPTYLDTVALSKFVNPELKNHKLDTIVSYYKLDDFHHHRASDDARALAGIFNEMKNRLAQEGVDTFPRMMEAMSERTDPKKLRPYHIILFAKNLAGLKNLYKLISASYLSYYKRFPRIPKSLLEQYRDGILIGSACEAGELYRAILDGRSDADIREIASFYDYLEIQPLCNNRFLIGAKDGVEDEEALKEINRRIVRLGKELGKPVCATCDAHFLNREDELYRKIILAGQKFADADKDVGIYLRNTEEMLAEFDYLGEETAHEVVIENPNKIADMIEKIRPIPKGRYEPNLEGAKEELVSSCWKRAHEWYGDPCPEIVEKRLTKELNAIIEHGFAVLYMIAVRLVAYSESLGYQVGSRGSVGSSFVATMSGISEVNPLPPHYRCPKCRHSEFFTDGSVGSGFDLDDKRCPECGEWMIPDGHDIPFETFLGFKGDKSPDIDLNFSGDVQGKVHKYTEKLFGEGHVFRAGTIGTLADKTAWGYINKYLEEKRIKIPKGQISYMVSKLVGIKRTTGQHPGGIIVVPTEFDVYDFTPVQHPADDPNSDIITTHFQFSYLHDTILKLDELGHDMPTKYKMLEKYTNTSVLDVKMNDKSIYELFYSTKPLHISPEDIGGCQLGTYGIPEMGTKFIQQVLLDAKPRTFADLLQVSGLTHGTDVWLGNAQDLIKAGTCDISQVVGTRDGIMLYLLRHGVEDSTSFKIMEDVRKGRGLKPEYEATMLEHGVPEWYIASCKKIKYMFPKAHAAAYVMSAIRLCWYKIYYPMEFYAAFFTVAPAGFDAEIVGGGYNNVCNVIAELEKKGNEATQKESELLSTLYLAREALARKVVFLNIDLNKSDASAFLPENGKIRMPFNSLQGLGDTAAEKIIEERKKGEFMSVEDLRQRTGISKSVIEILRRAHVLDGMSETNQLTFF